MVDYGIPSQSTGGDLTANYVLTQAAADLANGKVLIPGVGISITIVGSQVTIASSGGGGSVSSVSNSDGTLLISPTTGAVIASIATNGVGNSQIRQSAGLSIVGNPTNALANVQDISATGGNQFLGSNTSGTSLSLRNLAISDLPTGLANQHLSVGNLGLDQWNYGLDGVQALTSGTFTLSSLACSIYTLDTTLGSCNVFLPLASSCPGKVFYFDKMAGANSATVSTSGSDTLIATAGGQTSSSFDASVTSQIFGVISNGISAWIVIHNIKLPIQKGGTGMSTIPATGQLLMGNVGNTYSLINCIVDIGVIINGFGTALASGIVGEMVIDFPCTIQSVTILADQVGSCQWDILTCSSYSAFPASLASIVASDHPNLSSAQSSQDSTLTGWTTSIAAGNVIQFKLQSVTTCLRIEIILKVLRTG